MSHPIKQIVLIETLPGRAEEQVQAFAWLAPQVRAEAGCLSYQLHRVSGQENSFVLTETWASAAALAAHDASEHMQDAASWLASFRAGPARVLTLGEMHPAVAQAKPAAGKPFIPKHYLGFSLFFGIVLSVFCQAYLPGTIKSLTSLGCVFLILSLFTTAKEKGWLR